MLHGPGNWHDSRWTLFLVHSLRKFVNVVGVGFTTSFHRPNTGSLEIAVTIRVGNATTAVSDRCRRLLLKTEKTQ